MDNELLTIKEAATLAGVNISTLYKAIQLGKIEVESIPIRGKVIKKINKSELERVYGPFPMEANRSELKIPINSNRRESHPMEENGNESIPLETNRSESIPLEILKTAIKDVIEAERGQLMKPLEDQALYRLGRMEQENIFLKAKVETLLQELDQYKSLPGPGELEAWQIEKEDLLSRAEAIQKENKEYIRKAEGMNQVLLDNANNIKELAKEKDRLQSGFKEQEAIIKEKERALKELDELHQQELEQLRKEQEKKLKLMSDSAEKEKIEIVKAWKKKTEELERPWWKFW